MMDKKYVYFFGEGKADGSKDMKDLLGGKGAGLAEMTNLGIPVPPGFTITTEACIYYYKNGRYPDGLEEEIENNLSRLEKVMKKGFGDVENPLLVSVRSGAKISMPGMMDTVLNLGLNEETLVGLAKNAGSERFAFDAYRRFIQMFSNIVLGMEHSDFEKEMEKLKEEKMVNLDIELTAEDLKELVGRFKQLVKQKREIDFPTSPKEQLKMAIDAVFNSWNNPRAVAYRELNNIPHDLGTAVNVQAMVFGNMGSDSGTGVAFTRDPATGENRFYGEYLINAQGEDVVAGIRTPLPLERLNQEMPEVYSDLVTVYKRLETHYRDMLDLEFTFEKGRLFLLQTRSGKRTAQAAVKIAVDMVKEGLITKEEAIKRIDPHSIDQLLHPQIDPKACITVIAKGLPASPGASCGQVVFTAPDACRWVEEGKQVILVRLETSPEDISGMDAAQGILTARGGMTSHAAVVARGMGKCCVVGCEEITVDEERKMFTVKDKVIREGDFITLDGSSGNVILGQVKTIPPELKGEFSELLSWADEIRRLGIRANADTPRDAERARKFGAEGIGLCRTEHMFFEEERLPIMQQMILAKEEKERREALNKLLPMQKEDFREIFKAMDGLPVTIRLLDPPLHEFLPKHEELAVEIATLRATSGDEKRISELSHLLDKVEALKEMNPMLGFRGCRLGVVYPEISEMQIRAIFRAAIEVTQEGFKVIPEIMIPVLGLATEVRLLKDLITQVAKEEMERSGVYLNYSVGVMIELPRACVTADEIAHYAEFFSFGTNDLTQTTFGFSRDDIEGKFLQKYIEKGVLDNNPFAVLDRRGVGDLVRIGVERGRKTRPDLKIGICGEHGGEPSSIEFCHQVGLDYVSCSPFRVPIARLAAAHAKLKFPKNKDMVDECLVID
ncbi:MAG: pyruvate, phosphate dikinase [bacterium]|nr:pyruvate, phosphate dikinase [bacterium]